MAQGPAKSTAVNYAADNKASREIMGHPIGLYVLFFTELWERFNYYGMRALLILYMTKVYLFNDEFSGLAYGAYTGLVYATPLLGGFLADRILGYRRAIVLGGILMAIGELVMTLPGFGVIPKTTMSLYVALGFIIVGNGFFKPNISTIVGTLYKPGDARRDSAFTIFYMGINIGATLSPIICGTIGEKFGYHYGFLIAGIGMVIGLICFLAFGSYLGDKGLPPGQTIATRKRGPSPKEMFVWAGALVLVPIAAFLVSKPDYVSKWAAPLSLGVFLVYIFYEASKVSPVERRGIYVAIILAFSTLAFWGAFEQAGSSINLFTDRCINRKIGGTEIPASNFQAVNAIYIVLLAPIFSWMWVQLGKKGINPSSAIKFVLALLQVGAGYIFLYWAAKQAAAGLKPGMYLLLMTYFVHTTAELCLSPVGLSAMTKLAPQRLGGFIMGFWFLSTSFGQIVAGELASKQSAWGFDKLFFRIMIGGIAAGLILLCFAPILTRWERAKLAENASL